MESDVEASLEQRGALPQDVDAPSEDSSPDDPTRPEQEPQAPSVRLSSYMSHSLKLIQNRNPKHR